jgi:hypothetical protein
MRVIADMLSIYWRKARTFQKASVKSYLATRVLKCVMTMQNTNSLGTELCRRFSVVCSPSMGCECP